MHNKKISKKERMKIVQLIQNSGIDATLIPYCIELLQSVTGNDFTDFEWLAAVKKDWPESDALGFITELLSIFENVMDVNQKSPLERADVNRIFSQLVNLNRLSRGLDAGAIKKTKYNFSLLREEFLNSDHIASPGYSQEGEDLILARIFPRDKKGFFVDVGAHHPTRFSNTHFFYKRGWRGINIDPLPGSMELFNRIRPRDINLECAISSQKDGKGAAKYIRFEEPAFNTLIVEENEDVNQRLEASSVIDIIDVPVRELDDVLAEYTDEFDHIDLLNIDVELAELSVLETFTIQDYLPNVVVIEVRNFSIELKEQNPVYKYFMRHNYKLSSVLFNSILFEHES